jgi:metal-responsive CopG/Arc/MetJ family transcriptional regulator
MSDKVVRVTGRNRLARAAKQDKADKLEQFNILLDPEDRNALDEAARLEKLTRSDVIRRAIRAYYRKLRQTEAIAS